jgi:hypothetical protein
MPAHTVRFKQVDVFSLVLFKGNPLAYTAAYTRLRAPFRIRAKPLSATLNHKKPHRSHD